jgi:glycosyltransferase involved in cell wall biosynthesis
MANEERKHLIQQLLGEDLLVSIEVLRNYPDEEFINLARQELPPIVQEWLAGEAYLLAQGGANPGRHLKDLVQAVLSTRDFKLIVVGPYDSQQVSQLNAKYGLPLSDTVLFTGFVPQMEMVSYIDQALASVVFYDTTITNSNLCAPNRLYQAISRGVPVIVGTNPPLRSVVEFCACGVVVEPSQPGQIAAAIEQIAANRAVYRDRAASHSSTFVWETQMNVLGRVALGSDESA